MHTRDIMTTPLIALAPSTSLADASQLMARHGFSTLPVVDDQGRLLGLLSEETLAYVGVPADDDDARLRTAAAVMRTPGVAASADLDIAQVGHRMAESRVRALPVVDEGTLVGMVTFQDVLRALPVALLS
jgi:CBS domain-containing protein